MSASASSQLLLNRNFALNSGFYPGGNLGWIFYVLLAAGVILVVYYFQKQRIKRILELQKIRNRISRDLHDDIGSTLSSINILSTVATQSLDSDPKKTVEILQRISSNVQKMQEGMSDIVWSINPNNDELQNLALRLKTYALELLEPVNTSLILIVSPNIEKLRLSMDQRRDLYLICKEALNNVAKYSQALEVCVTVALDHGNIHIEVKDDGKGFDPDNRKIGNGLVNMRERARKMGGLMEINTSPGNGCKIKFEIPVQPVN